MDLSNILNYSNLSDIVLFVLALVIVWILLRFILRLTVRFFSCGCVLIVLVGIALLILRATGNI
jgi:hypothetical protein